MDSKSQVFTVERATKIIDELLVLFELYEQDYNIIDDALEFIAESRRKNPQYQITVSLADFMAKKRTYLIE